MFQREEDELIMSAYPGEPLADSSSVLSPLILTGMPSQITEDDPTRWRRLIEANWGPAFTLNMISIKLWGFTPSVHRVKTGKKKKAGWSLAATDIVDIELPESLLPKKWEFNLMEDESLCLKSPAKLKGNHKLFLLLFITGTNTRDSIYSPCTQP